MCLAQEQNMTGDGLDFKLITLPMSHYAYVPVWIIDHSNFGKIYKKKYEQEIP